MVGSAIIRTLEANGYSNIVVKSSKELDLKNQQAVHDFFNQELDHQFFFSLLYPY